MAERGAVPMGTAFSGRSRGSVGRQTTAGIGRQSNLPVGLGVSPGAVT